MPCTRESVIPILNHTEVELRIPGFNSQTTWTHRCYTKSLKRITTIHPSHRRSWYRHATPHIKMRYIMLVCSAGSESLQTMTLLVEYLLHYGQNPGYNAFNSFPRLGHCTHNWKLAHLPHCTTCMWQYYIIRHLPLLRCFTTPCVMRAMALTTSRGAPLDSEIISPLSATMKAFPGTQ